MFRQGFLPGLPGRGDRFPHFCFSRQDGGDVLEDAGNLLLLPEESGAVHGGTREQLVPRLLVGIEGGPEGL
ncbi:hypothetical protein D9M72_400540 [compost metagenome]